jgi:gamma-glutamyltranspeptidase/glutathione hydrolase
LPPFKSGLVVSANSLASKAGARILKKGGNAIDAAITTAHMLGVAAPAFSGVGGGGFALIWLAREGKAVFVDFREKAPSAAREDMFKLTATGNVVGKENSVGYKSVAVPGTVSGHALILEKYGTVSLRETLDEAAKTAQRGFIVSRALAYVWKLGARKLGRFKESKSTYMKRGRPYREGDKITLRDLAKTLKTIGQEGHEEFYSGTIARKIVDDMESNKGLLTAPRLEDYEPTIREPLRGTYKDYEIISAPPPSCGGAMILQSLNILEQLSPEKYQASSAQEIHLLAEALARSAMTCRESISDPAFSSHPVDRLISKEFARELTSTISLTNSSIPSTAGSRLMPASNTTHLVAIDAEHNVVSLTESLECYFGSGVTVAGTGVLLNDTMHDFEPRPHMTNSVAPGKIPMSNMSPTIVLRDGRPIFALGSAGGPRIVSSTLQVLFNVFVDGMELRDAVAAPRIHMNGPRIQLEEGVGRRVFGELHRMGHSVEIRKRAGKDDPGLYFGGVHAAAISSENSSLSGAPDPRRDGLASGLR